MIVCGGMRLILVQRRISSELATKTRAATMSIVFWTVLLFVSVTLHTYRASSRLTGPAKNVLMLISDDMRPDIRAYGAEHMITPNLDRLASRSVVLRRAYVQQAVCSPSRTSMLTGRRPDTTRVHDLIHYWRKVAGNFTTLPEYFKQHGYKTAGIGKVGILFFLYCQHRATFLQEYKTSCVVEATDNRHHHIQNCQLLSTCNKL